MNISSQSRRRIGHLIAVNAVIASTVLGLILVLAPIAAGAQSRAYTGVSFGRDGVAGAEPFETVSGIAVDQTNGDVYVLDSGSGSAEAQIYKFDEAGQPSDFSATATNVIHTGVEVRSGSSLKQQISVAPSGAPGGTEGDIYVATGSRGALFPGEKQASVNVYTADGSSLGEFGFPGSCAAGIDRAGNVLTETEESKGGAIAVYEPKGNPPVDSDLAASGTIFKGLEPCVVSTDGAEHFYFSTPYKGEVFKANGLVGAEPISLGKGIMAAVDYATGNVFIDRGNRVVEYGPGAQSQLGTFSDSQLRESRAVAGDATGTHIYVGTSESFLHERVQVFGPPVAVPTLTIGTASTPLPDEATVHGTVDPNGMAITECLFEYGTTEEYGQTAPCDATPPPGSGPTAVSATLSGLAPDGNVYHFRLSASNANGTERSSDSTFATGASVITEPTDQIAETTAVVHGKVFPFEGPYIGCKFEYGLASEATLPEEASCVPSAATFPVDGAYHNVSAHLVGLLANDTRYRVRLTASTASGTVSGQTMVFTTSGDPELSEVRSRDAGQKSAFLEATVDPHGFETEYAIEWGPTSSYGQVALSGMVEPGQGPTTVTARLTGLEPATSYHFRVVAASSADRVESTDRVVETLNHCELPQGRCLELVSQSDAGPVASPGHGTELLEFELQSKAAERGSALAYVSESGFPGASRGAEVLYRATRSESGWANTQLSPGITVLDESQGENSNSSRMLAMSPELNCGVVETNQLLPGSTPRMSEVLEAGGQNIYRLNADGSYTPISTRPPENLVLPEVPQGKRWFRIGGMSTDCSRIIFMSVYRYPGTEALEDRGHVTLYEWNEGVLRSVGVVPSPTGETRVPGVTLGDDLNFESERADRNAVSSNGSRVFFTASRLVGKNPGEVGTPGLFVREGGSKTTDVSESETTVPDEAPSYQWSTPDGSLVYFTAPAGLTSTTSSEGTDLYVYDLAKSPSEHPLSDLSANQVESSAEVAGMLGGSSDGARVYFAATGRLVAGEGLSAARNAEEGTYSIYEAEHGVIRFVATVSQKSGALNTSLLLGNSSQVTSDVSPDGRYLLFESAAGTDGTEKGLSQVYLFDADANKEAISCVSCMPPGGSEVRKPEYELLPPPVRASSGETNYQARALSVKQGVASVTFSSPDELAPGAVKGGTNLYEWSHGQVFLLTAEPAGLRRQANAFESPTERLVFSLGANLDGTDLYFTSPSSLTWDSVEGRSSVYDARIGGGFQQPPAASVPCDPNVEGACQSAPAAVETTPAAASANSSGPGNLKPKQCQKRSGKKHGQCGNKKPGKKRRRTQKHGKRRNAAKHHKKHRAGGKPKKSNAQDKGGSGK
jgi:hypothetical protein